MLRKVAIGAALISFGLVGGLSAQLVPPPGGIKRTLLQKVDVPGTNYEVILGMAEVAAGKSSGRHTHPGPETGTVLEGEAVLLVDGQPETTLKPGDSYQIAPETIHDVRTGAHAAKVIAIYVVPKGQPIATPAK